MNIRQSLSMHSTTATVATAVIFVVALLAIFMQATDRPAPSSTGDNVYYYDLNSHDLFAGPRNEIPPIESPSGPHQDKPGGVRAYVFTCSDCTSKQWTIGYLETFTDKAKHALRAERRKQQANPNSRKPILRPDSASPAVAQGWMIRTVDDPAWLPVRHPQARQIMANANLCERAVARPCYP